MMQTCTKVEQTFTCLISKVWFQTGLYRRATSNLGRQDAQWIWTPEDKFAILWNTNYCKLTKRAHRNQKIYECGTFEELYTTISLKLETYVVHVNHERFGVYQGWGLLEIGGIHQGYMSFITRRRDLFVQFLKLKARSKMTYRRCQKYKTQ